MREFIEKNILPKVEKPLRYLGDEWNTIHKSWENIRLKTVFAFPDVYEVAMSHLGLSIIYHVVNEQPDFLMERVFAPWVDLEEQLKKNNLPLFSLESFKPLLEFDVIGFTLQYEMSYTNILNMLSLGQVPLKSMDRDNTHPLVIAGGPCVYNPEPLAEFIDAFIIGDGEEVVLEVFEVIAQSKEKENFDRWRTLERLAQIEGLYIPRFYDVTYLPDGSLEKITTNNPLAAEQITKRVLPDLDRAYFPTKPIVPYLEVVHDRAVVEVLRGCTRGCRFCQAGMIYRPVRERSPEVLQAQLAEILPHTGHNELSLTSLSSSDYTCIESLITQLLDEYEEKKIGVSLPSLRVDSFSMNLAQQVQRVRKSSLTFAPEAGTQRLRDVINKGVTEENLMKVAKYAFANGWSQIKLYFMIGLPTETKEDLDGIVDLAYKVLNLGDQIRKEKNLSGPRPRVTISVASFVPKAHTPFQWEAQDDLAQLLEKQEYLKNKIKNRRITYNYHDAQLSFVEAVFAKGDRRLGAALHQAWQKGCKFDGWSQHFQYDIWMEALTQVGLDPQWYAYRTLDHQEILPWEHIFSGLRKDFLIQEHQKALRTAVTEDCRFAHCHHCGVCQDLNVALNLKEGSQVAVKN